MFSLHFDVTVHHQRKSVQKLKPGRNLEAGADVEAVEDCGLLACSLWLAPLHSYRTQDHLHSTGIAPSTTGWPRPRQLLIKKMTCLQPYLKDKVIFSDDFSLCQVDIRPAGTPSVRPSEIAWPERGLQSGTTALRPCTSLRAHI